VTRPILYQYWGSSASWRVRWALAIKGIAHDVVAVDLRGGAQYRPDYVKRNPIGHVPGLEMDGRVLGESVAILEYLEDRHPEPPLYPQDPWLRARVRQVCEIVNAGIQPLQNLAATERHSNDPAEQAAFAAHFNARGLAALERLLRAIDEERGAVGRFAVGDELTAADLFVVPQVASARRFGVDLGASGRVLSAEAAARATRHAEGARPENQPDGPRLLTGPCPSEDPRTRR